MTLYYSIREFSVLQLKAAFRVQVTRVLSIQFHQHDFYCVLLSGKWMLSSLRIPVEEIKDFFLFKNMKLPCNCSGYKLTRGIFLLPSRTSSHSDTHYNTTPKPNCIRTGWRRWTGVGQIGKEELLLLNLKESAQFYFTQRFPELSGNLKLCELAPPCG